MLAINCLSLAHGEFLFVVRGAKLDKACLIQLFIFIVATVCFSILNTFIVFFSKEKKM